MEALFLHKKPKTQDQCFTIKRQLWCECTECKTLAKQCRPLTWKVSRGLASSLKVSRSVALWVVPFILIRARKRLYEYHTKGLWRTTLVDGTEQLPSLNSGRAG